MADPQVRIARIAGRYLVFDARDVACLRRQHGICAVFTGTLPQSPAQNIFLGLPAELYAEEARMLVERGVAYVADDPAAHLAQLGAMDEAARRAYVQSLQTQRRDAQRVADEAAAQKTARFARAQRSAKPSSARVPPPEPVGTRQEGEVEEDEEDVLFDTPSPRTSATSQSSDTAATATRKGDVVGITPTTSSNLINPTACRIDIASIAAEAEAEAAPRDAHPLYAHLNARGYYVTPGLRFGGDYSVYPGDPFRYHAHFLASTYGWDEEIPMLDIVSSGRLGTSVKKGFMMGGQRPAVKGGSEGEGEVGEEVRTFSIEWARM